jgi:hypothetical protein
MISPQMRQQLVLSFEGQALTNAHHHGAEGAAEMARCVIDGTMNALIRIEGPVEAAKFALALGDRVVGSVRAPTVRPEPESPKLPKITAPQPVSAWAMWSIGCWIGFAIAIAFGAVR